MQGVIGPTVARLQSADFDKTTMEEISLQRLSPATALTEVGFRRLDRSGATIETLAVLYLFQRQNAGWRIATIVLHPVDTLFEIVPSTTSW